MKIPSDRETRPGWLPRFLFATAVVAILDISFAATYWVVIRGATTFPRVLQSIAAALLGKASFQGGTATALLGGVLHCIVAAGWTAVFLIAVHRWSWPRQQLQSPFGAAKLGMPYGVFVWLMMTFAIIPLSHATPASATSSWFWISLVWHAVGVGLPIAMIARVRH